MSLWDRVTHFLAMEPMQASPIQVRTDLGVGFDDFDSQLLAIRRRQARSQPWRQASIREAMGVPAIFGAVTLVSNLVGSMSMKAMRNEVELPPDDRPRLIVRPDPFTIPREFYRATTYNIASRGEADWWIAMRDLDGQPMSILNMPPREVKIEENPRDLRFPIITWRDKRIPNDDFRQLVYAKEPGELRGVGPLQMCGAAVSVSVESQEWAANTYAEGGKPSITIKHAGELDATLDEDGYSEADILKLQWTNSPPNVPRVIDQNIDEIKEFGGTSAASEMLSSRDYQVGEVARMFHIPASLLEYAVAGSSLTYQNVGMEFEKLLRQCLEPDYMTTIEQTMTDLLTRSTVARFNSDALTLADIKTRWDVYNAAIPVIGQEDAAAMARRGEGLAPGDIENAAIPFSPPSAVPASFPIEARTTIEDVRCTGKIVIKGLLQTCNRRLGKLAAPYEVTCPRCKTVASAARPLAPIVTLPVRTHVAVRTTPTEPVPSEPTEIQVLRGLVESLPDRIAAAIPKPDQPMVLQVHEGAFRSDVHMPPVAKVQKRVERDGTGYVITEE